MCMYVCYLYWKVAWGSYDSWSIRSTGSAVFHRSIFLPLIRHFRLYLLLSQLLSAVVNIMQCLLFKSSMNTEWGKEGISLGWLMSGFGWGGHRIWVPVILPKASAGYPHSWFLSQPQAFPLFSFRSQWQQFPCSQPMAPDQDMSGTGGKPDRRSVPAELLCQLACSAYALYRALCFAPVGLICYCNNGEVELRRFRIRSTSLPRLI